MKHLCSEISAVEWSGVLFFETEGEINSEQGLTITPIDIYPMDKGSSAYTEYDFSEQVFDYYDHFPERFGMKYGHIHSHNTMQSFFSGTDVQELIDNCVNHSYYVSLIVNNRNEMVARVAIPGKREVKGSSIYSFSGILGKIINFKKDTNNEENVMYYIDMDIEKAQSPALNQFFLDKVKELKEKPLRTISFTQGQGFEFGNYNQSFNRDKNITHKQKEFDFTHDEKNKEDLPISKILSECLGGVDKQTLPEIIDDIIRDAETTDNSDEDIKFYLQQSLDTETIIENIQENQRFPNELPDINTVLDVMKRFKGLFNYFRSAKTWKVCNMAIEILDKEMAELKIMMDEKPGF